MRRFLVLIVFLELLCIALWADVKVMNVEVKPRWPWNGLVVITYSIECNEVNAVGEPMDVFVDFTGYDRDLDRTIRLKTLTGEGASGPVKAGGPYTVTWNAGADGTGINAKEFSFRPRETTIL